MNVAELIEDLIVREGGFVDDPDDPGGVTKYGITLPTLKRVRPKAERADVVALTKAEAVEIYRALYYHASRIDQLPETLRPSVFDFFVNAGSRAIRILQTTLNHFGENLRADGQIGPATLAATARVIDKAGHFLIDAYGIERREFYYRLADRRAASRKYARSRDGGKGGWIKRAEEFISPRYHYSEAEHQARIKDWN